MTGLAAGGVIKSTGTLANIGTGGHEWVVPLRPTDDATAEVIEAADDLDRKLPHPPTNGNNWWTVGDRLDEAMRARLIEFGNSVI